ncbi:MAG: hypothetical protein AB1585_00665 [Thermodesulfobacteriota bacterium]
MLLVLGGMILVMLVFVGVSGLTKGELEKRENYYIHEHGQYIPVLKNGLYEKPGYWERYYLLNFYN